MWVASNSSNRFHPLARGYQNKSWSNICRCEWLLQYRQNLANQTGGYGEPTISMAFSVSPTTHSAHIPLSGCFSALSVALLWRVFKFSQIMHEFNQSTSFSVQNLWFYLPFSTFLFMVLLFCNVTNFLHITHWIIFQLCQYFGCFFHIYLWNIKIGCGTCVQNRHGLDKVEPGSLKFTVFEVILGEETCWRRQFYMLLWTTSLEDTQALYMFKWTRGMACALFHIETLIFHHVYLGHIDTISSQIDCLG